MRHTGKYPFGQREGLDLEFKEAADSLPKSFFETVCAFLNLEGGLIILGVTDGGMVTGIHPAAVNRIKIEIANLSNNPNKLDPPHLLFPHAEDVGGKWIIKYLPFYAPGAGAPSFVDEDMFVVIVPLEAATGKSDTEVTPEVTPEVEQLLPLCTKPQTRRELQDALRLKDDDHFRVAYILSAMNGGFIEMTIPDKPRSRNQKYRLTDKGRRVLCKASVDDTDKRK